VTATDNGTLHEHLVVAGQSAGLIADMPPVAEIVHRIAAEAVQALRDAGMH
jgi:hypothetical protein